MIVGMIFNYMYTRNYITNHIQGFQTCLFNSFHKKLKFQNLKYPNALKSSETKKPNRTVKLNRIKPKKLNYNQ
jgi:hypothetical protein